MNIRNEKSTDLTQRLTIEIVKDDYATEVENALKKQRQKAVIPGFRAGNAPMGLVKKMYYRSILLDHLNRTVDEKLFGYLKDHNINILLEPLPIDEETDIDIDNREDFTFTFEYALRPQIKIEWEKLPAVKKFTIKASEREIEEYTTKLRQRYGKYTNPESIALEDDHISVSYDHDKKGYFYLNALNKAGQILLKDKKLKEEVELSFASAFNTPQDLAKFLKIEEKDIEEGNPYTYTVTIDSVGRMELADYDETFFQKAFPDGRAKNEKDVKKIAAEEVEKHWKEETSKFFMNDAIGVLLEHVIFELPDDFIKRYVLMTQKEMTAEKLEEQYAEMVKAFKWQLIEHEFSMENDLAVTQEDIKDYIREFFMANYFSQFNPEEIKEHLDKLVGDALKNKEDVKRIYDTLFDKKMETLLVSKMKLDEHCGDFEEFITFMKGEDAPTPKKKTQKADSGKQNAEEGNATPKAEAKPKKTTTTTKKTTKKEE